MAVPFNELQPSGRAGPCSHSILAWWLKTIATGLFSPGGSAGAGF
jgi:hypothetical protein